MDLLSYQNVFDIPYWLTPYTAWSEHIPFAFFLTEVHQPRSFVELGTAGGESYCAFCQAVVKLGLPTRCIAVDTWRGDAHFGHYDGLILQRLQAHHHPRYSRFSSLVQMDFDSVADRMADGSIDLLHIDGLHTYAAVKHDFERWLPKMSDRGVILFHDTAILDRGFGVHQLFEEISANRPHFEFQHGNGLGIVATGNNLPAATVEFFQVANAHHDRFRSFFSTVGGRLGEMRLRGLLVEQVRVLHGSVTQWRKKCGLTIPPGADSQDYMHGIPMQTLQNLWDQFQLTIHEYEAMKRSALPAAPLHAEVVHQFPQSVR